MTFGRRIHACSVASNYLPSTPEAGKRIAPLRADNPLALTELINALEKDKVHETVYETGGGGTACLARF
jgi:hypothetical protein